MTVSTQDAQSVFSRRTVVGVGDIAFSTDPNTSLSTYALGSCIGVIAFDVKKNIGALLHFMLPNSDLTPDKAQSHPAMFADSGMALLLEQFRKSQSNLRDINFFLAGGASLLSENDMFKIGKKNIDAIRSMIEKYELNVVAEEIGGYNNRTLHFKLKTASIEVKSSTEIKEISIK